QITPTGIHSLSSQSAGNRITHHVEDFGSFNPGRLAPSSWWRTQSRQTSLRRANPCFGPDQGIFLRRGERQKSVRLGKQANCQCLNDAFAAWLGQMRRKQNRELTFIEQGSRLKPGR